MFVRPNRTVFSELVKQAGVADFYSNLPEQSLISRYFQGRWLGLNSDYNLPFLFVYSQRRWFYDQRRRSARVLHFAGDYKAWNGCAQVSQPFSQRDRIDLMQVAFSQGR
jgi:lipopolysaccharide biosynthesis glycosyltransferase